MERYDVSECIGRGSYGDVFKGIDKETGKQVALKVIDLEDVEDDIEDIHKEISMLAGCRCKNITEYYGSVIQPGTTELMIVMELMACSVADLLVHGVLDEPQIAYVLREVLGALAYLHSEHRIHRDVKAANILLSGGGSPDVKISDFGVSGQLSGTMGFRRRTFVGTPFWMAPEVIESSDEGYSESADIWSLGITAIEMATGSPPHADLHPMRVLFLIPKEPAPTLEGAFSDGLKDFVSRCLQKDASARPSARELLAHPFVADAPPEAPAGLAEMVSEYSKRRKPVQSRRDAGSEILAGGTLPGWDFGPKGLGRITIRMGDTVKASTVDRYLNSAKASHGGAGSAAGTLKAAPRTSGAVSAAGSDTRPLKDHSTAGASDTLRSGTLVAGGAASTRYSAQPTASEESSEDAYGTVRINHGAQPDKFGTIQSKQTPVPRDSPAKAATVGGAAAAAMAASVSSSGTVAGPAGGNLSLAAAAASSGGSSSMKRGGTLQVEIANPATASPDKAALLAQQQAAAQAAGASGQGPAAGGPGQGGTPTADGRLGPGQGLGPAESAAALAHVLLPSVQSVAARAPEHAQVQALTSSLQAQLHQLEKAMPGACSSLLQELLIKLSTGPDREPALQPARTAASALFGAGSTPSGQGNGAAMPGRKVGPLGPLGEFLLGRWQEEAAHERVLLARAAKLPL